MRKDIKAAFQALRDAGFTRRQAKYILCYGYADKKEFELILTDLLRELEYYRDNGN